METAAITFFAAHGIQKWEGASRASLARILYRANELQEAEIEARRAVGLLEQAKANQVFGLAILASVLLAQGRSSEALATSCEAMALPASLGRIEEGDTLIRLAHAEALFATGDHDSARAAIADARDHLLAAAARIDDPRWRDSFLHNVPENARTLELSRTWLGDGRV